MEASGVEGGRGLRRNAVGLPGLIAQSLGVTAPEISAVALAVFAISWLGIQISARILLALTAIGVTMLLILDVIILAKGGAHGWAWSSLAPWKGHGFGFGFFALGVGIAMTGFSGFETAVFLAEEAHTPKREVPKAVLGAVALARVFYIVTTFSVVTGYGLDQAGKHWPQDSGGAVVGLSAQYAALWFGKLLLLLLAISAFA